MGLWKIKLPRGNKANLPSLSLGEPAYVTDEGELYIGGVNGENINITNNAKIKSMLNKNAEELVYYVSTSGSDNNDGLSLEKPFLTIKKAISMIPDFIYDNVTIYIGDGTYNEDVVINCKHGKAGINIIGNINIPTNVKINRNEIQNSTANILVKGITGISSDKTCFSVNNSTYVAFDNCVCTTQSDFGAFEFLMSKGIVRNCTMNNRFYAILSQYNSSVFTTNCTGINNSVVLKALNNGVIGKNSSGTLPEGTTAESIGNGGVVR